jgi:hypothetical protein
MEALRRPRAISPREFERALAEQLPLIKRDGGFVAKAMSPRSTRPAICATPRASSSPRCRRATPTTPASRALKIRHNNVLGYFVEVTAQHGDKLMAPPLNATFIHRQTLAGQVRFTTSELGEIEAKIANAGDRALGLELEIFERLCAMALAASDDLRAAAHALALLDVATALAKLAVDDNYVRPEVDGSLGFAIEGGRHPVVEQALKRDGQPFIANACDLSPGPAQKSGQIWLITGPNMAGKSTFLRQNALIALLAQIGSFVPATRARIGVVDRLFSRVGAADDLARGRSTFMVEMVETAAILNQASERSLVILDEIGRGTATFDGLSIAWAAIEHLHESNRCRALFATHYHELTALSAKLPRLFNATVRVKEWQGDVVFLHEVLPGSADRSYGIQVAGGYGRGLMAPESDIDLLFILPYKQTAWGEQVAEAILYCLWDMGLKVGHATRSVDESIRQARGDMTIRTAILETRFLTGDQPLYDELVARFDKEVVQGTAANSSPPSSPSARSATAAPASRAIWSSPTSRTARAACATCTRCSGSRNMSTACARPTSWSSAACSTRRNTAPSAAAPISCGRCAATCISSPAAPRSGCRSTCSARSRSGSATPRIPACRTSSAS